MIITAPCVDHAEHTLGILWRGECTIHDPDAVFTHTQATVEVVIADPALELHLDTEIVGDIVWVRLVDQHGAVRATTTHAIFKPPPDEDTEDTNEPDDQGDYWEEG